MRLAKEILVSSNPSDDPLEVIVTHYPQRIARPLYSAIAFLGPLAGRSCDGETELEAIDNALQALGEISGKQRLDRRHAQVRRQTVK
jgi:hypothetical protein